MQKNQNIASHQHIDDSKMLIKSLNDQIDFLKSEIKSKKAIITAIILDYHENEMREPKGSGNRKESNTGNTNDNHKYQLQIPRKLSKMKKADNNKDFSLLNCFEIMQDDVKEKWSKLK